MPVLNPNALIDERVTALRKAHADARCTRAELDLSGGIDSAVLAGLLVLALGPENVILAHTRFSTNPEQTQRAENLARALNCRLAVGDFGPAFTVVLDEILRSLVAAGYDRAEIDARIAADPTILGSIRSTLRAPLGRAYNRLTGGGLRAGTGNEDEDRVLRFYQKGGDGEVDNNPIAFLSKGETYQLALALGRHLNALDAFLPIIEATPSPDLWGKGDAHSDEAELLSWTGAPFTYSRIDSVTGEYNYVGTIERVNRFLDHVCTLPDGSKATGEKLLFGDNEPIDGWRHTVTLAHESGYFEGIDLDTIERLLRAARKVEAITRHKLNPNCPTYGDRASLVEEGILTDTLPTIPVRAAQKIQAAAV